MKGLTEKVKKCKGVTRKQRDVKKKIHIMMLTTCKIKEGKERRNRDDVNKKNKIKDSSDQSRMFRNWKVLV